MDSRPSMGPSGKLMFLSHLVVDLLLGLARLMIN